MEFEDLSLVALFDYTICKYLVFIASYHDGMSRGRSLLMKSGKELLRDGVF